MSTSAGRESLLLLSDVHLGSDLNDGGETHPRSEEIDADLARCIEHYASDAPGPFADRWRLVLVGDFVDFVGMSVDPRPGDSLRSALTDSEKAYGLHGGEDRVLVKLSRAEERHPDVFAALRKFVVAGNAITFLQGNHDLEMHWEGVQDALRQRVCAEADDPDAASARIDFEPWFLHRQGFVYIEHGHQYDPFCAIPYILAPLSPRDPTRVFPSLSDALLRYIVRRTPGMKEYGHEGRGLASYISWGLGLGARGAVDLGRRFAECIRMLRHVAAGYATSEGAIVQKKHEQRLIERARRSGVEVETLEAALALHVAPLGSTPRLVLASVMLDRLAVSAAATVMLVFFVAVHQWPSAFVVLVVFALLHVELSAGRPNIDPASLMAERARELARLFPASFVVMGHTHTPDTRELGVTTYVNLGSWAEGKPDVGERQPYRAARTHLVLHENDGRHEAELRAWKNGKPEAMHALVRPVPPR